MPTPGSVDTAGTWPTSEGNLGHCGLNSGALGCTCTWLKAWHQEHTESQLSLSLGTPQRLFQSFPAVPKGSAPSGTPWRTFQSTILTQCPRPLVPPSPMQQLCMFCQNLIHFQDAVKILSQLIPLAQIPRAELGLQDHLPHALPTSTRFPWLLRMVYRHWTRVPCTQELLWTFSAYKAQKRMSWQLCLRALLK